MQTLFLSHGSPMLALEDAPTTRFMRNVSSAFSRPKAILVASAHWESKEPMITGAQRPVTIHDFYGFPPELYALRYPAQGNPELAARVKALLSKASFNAEIDNKRGLDHGVWNPLLLMYPAADIPVVELSVQPTRDANWHYSIGAALAPLRDEQVLIVGSGNLTHNLREAFHGHYEKVPTWVSDFARWVAEKIAEKDHESLLDWQTLAPHAKQNHPTVEHFLPFFVALGAAGKSAIARRLHQETDMGVLAMDAYGFGS